ncbi:hypothetical protein TTHERM_00715740 (macronuclear) [Tetrahymena thermophila SB210]|uniref:Uncharacterized protein n=1 Tax=Tetrahymena thermophila (strain SB210) TaxID=312017 RepID=I7LT40_TETTS|nr:hypothetical protein TTHERM_00715740 [Tetrahymena thermophila SB210]EAR84270.1 hypothetical protein TTHERM_00715740 [Tetrahymena thermophila SB210]|eukprot:XP_001031933.1 hypothetical protein TTHERM_00715740 [Tetrahymena thermophila SB210]
MMCDCLPVNIKMMSLILKQSFQATLASCQKPCMPCNTNPQIIQKENKPELIPIKLMVATIKLKSNLNANLSNSNILLRKEQILYYLNEEQIRRPQQIKKKIKQIKNKIKQINKQEN